MAKKKEDVIEEIASPEIDSNAPISCVIKGQGVQHVSLNGLQQELPCGVSISVTPEMYSILKNSSSLED